MKRLLLSLFTLLALNSYSQNVNIPDANFKAYLVGNTAINTNLDTEIQVTEATAFNGDINCPLQNIADMTGLESFTSLTGLYCGANQLTSLDVTQNTALITLYCFLNQLYPTIDLSQNTALTELRCENTQLSSLDVTQNTALTYLNCYNNGIASLDVSQNTVLTELNCSTNELTSLDVSQNTSLTILDCADNQLQCLNANNGQNMDLDCDNNQLSCISVGNLTWYFNYASCDPWVTFQIQCPLSQNNNDVNQFGNQLSAEQNGATYQWLDCDNNYAVINGETNQSFTALSSGNYAVEITTTNCFGINVDSSTCMNVDCQSEINNDVNQIGALLSSEQNGATYQWLDCDNNYAVINGETNQSYTVQSSGNYVVEITITDLCGGVQVDTSTCVNVDCQSEINNDVNQNGALLSSEQNGATYQWLDCDNNYAVISGETNQTYTPTTTGYFAVELTFTDACGGLQVDTSSCHLVDYSGITELDNAPKQLLKIVDLMGRETTYKPNVVLIYMYTDGTAKRVLEVQ